MPGRWGPALGTVGRGGRGLEEQGSDVDISSQSIKLQGKGCLSTVPAQPQDDEMLAAGHSCPQGPRLGQGPATLEEH